MSDKNRIQIGKIIHRIDRSFALVESGLLISILSMMILLAFLQVILRNFFSTSFFWGDPLLRHWVLWIGFLGASIAARKNRHISIDALYRILPSVWKRKTHIITCLFSSVICGLLTRAALVFVRNEWISETQFILNLPLWPFVIIIPVGFLIITLRFLLKAFSFSIKQGNS